MTIFKYYCIGSQNYFFKQLIQKFIYVYIIEYIILFVIECIILFQKFTLGRGGQIHRIHRIHHSGYPLWLNLVELHLTHLPISSNDRLVPLFASFSITSLQFIVIVHHQNHVRLICRLVRYFIKSFLKIQIRQNQGIVIFCMKISKLVKQDLFLIKPNLVYVIHSCSCFR